MRLNFSRLLYKNKTVLLMVAAAYHITAFLELVCFSLRYSILPREIVAQWHDLDREFTSTCNF